MKNIRIAGLIFLIVSLILLGTLFLRSKVSAAVDRPQPASIQPGAQGGAQPNSIGATGTVHSKQSAPLSWKISGVISSVNVKAGDRVTGGQELASLAPASLPQQVILAQADLTEANKALENLLTSNLQQAQALQALEDAQKALDNIKNSKADQAKGVEAVANAQRAVDQANLQVYVLIHPVSQEAIDQAHANMLLAQNKVNNDQKQINRLEALARKVPAFFRPKLNKALRGMKTGLLLDQDKVQHEVDQYNRLQRPPDPTELAVAQANLNHAKAQLADVQRTLGRVKNGPLPADLAVADAKLADAVRNYDRVKNGPNPDDVAAAKARVTADQAAFNQISITAPFSGVITDVSGQRGDQVKAGTPAFRLDDLSRILVEVPVSEVDINSVKIGQPVTITFDAIQGKEYHGKVTEVAPVGKSSQGVVNFDVTVEMSDADQQIKPGMTAGVQIQID